MTEMKGLGVEQCGNCYYWIKIEAPLGYCHDVLSDHYGHVILRFHPACDNFCEEGDRE